MDESNKEDVYNRILDGAKEDVGIDYARSLDLIPHDINSVSKNLDKERREWEQDREKARKEHQRQLQQNPILYYCAKIRGTIFIYEMSFEDYIKYKVEYLEAKRKAYWKEEEEDYIMNSSLSQTTDGQEPTTTETKFQESMKERITNIEKWEHGIYDKHKPAFVAKYTKPESMSNTRWQKKMRRERKLLKEKSKERVLDNDFRSRNSPQRMFIGMIEGIGCECETEKMRAGVFCETCILLSRVRQSMLDLFKDAAEGRTSYV